MKGEAAVETARLFLRLPEVADAEPFMAIHQDPEVIELKQVTLTEPVGGIDVALRNVARMTRHWESRGYGQWAVVEKGTGDVIGCVGFFHPEGWPGVDLNWIVHRSKWGHGFASEAARAALQWAWETDNIGHVISLIAPSNLRSIRVATKIGECFERADVDPINGEAVHVYGVRRPERPNAPSPFVRPAYAKAPGGQPPRETGATPPTRWRTPSRPCVF